MNAFQQFSEINRSRAMRWHRGGLDEWSVTDWSNALAGETGELCNAVKKFRRVEDAIQGHDGDTPQPQSQAEAIRAIAKEIGDVYAYLDLVAQRFGLDTFCCIRATFNQISEREEMPERIPTDFDADGGLAEILGEIAFSAQLIAEDRDFVVHGNRVTERAIAAIQSLAGPLRKSEAALPVVLNPCEACRKPWDAHPWTSVIPFDSTSRKSCARFVGVRKHRCMRCLELFDCENPDYCMVAFDALPVIVGGDPSSTKDHCPRDPDWDWIRAYGERRAEAALVAIGWRSA